MKRQELSIFEQLLSQRRRRRNIASAPAPTAIHAGDTRVDAATCDPLVHVFFTGSAHSLLRSSSGLAYFAGGGCSRFQAVAISFVTSSSGRSWMTSCARRTLATVVVAPPDVDCVVVELVCTSVVVCAFGG